jgi:hypothetical protein
LNCFRFCFNFGFKFNLRRYIMDGQPLTLLARTRDGSALGFRFEIWHERLLAGADTRPLFSPA